MAHHKRKGPKSTRAGCLLCKPHKRQGSRLLERQQHGATRRIVAAGEQMAEGRAVRRPGGWRAPST